MRIPTALATAAALLLAARAAPIPGRDPVGESFPAAGEKSLEGEPRALPHDLFGAPAVPLVGDEDLAFDLTRGVPYRPSLLLQGAIRIARE